VAVAVTATQAAAANGDGSQRPSKKHKKGEDQTAAAADGGGGVLQQATPSSLRMEYIVCSIQVKLPQLVSAGHAFVSLSLVLTSGLCFPCGTGAAGHAAFSCQAYGFLPLLLSLLQE
jgi:hypothetical protein